ncbi:MAG: Mrp/NBP35 family ATP-binding protein [Planctomycetota bacterium]
MLSKETILDALATIDDPELHRDLVTLNRVESVDLEGEEGAKRARIGIKVDRLNGPGQEALRASIEGTVRAAAEAVGGGLDGVEVVFSTSLSAMGGGGGAGGGGGQSQPAAPSDAASEGNPLPHVKHVIAVGAGKGGVGKSTVAINLAVGLARMGRKVGLMDGDIYGPSVPTMLGSDRYEPRAVGQVLLPFELHGIKAMSIGDLVEDGQALIWRGPMAHGAFKQLATQTDWGELDFLIIDLPPGTGDVCLTMSQLLPLTGAVIVCTPQKVAQDDAKRAHAMFDKLGIPVLGLVENMSYFIGDDGKEYDLFGKGGAEMLAHQLAVPFLGGVPINTALRRHCDAGDPSANFTKDDGLAESFTGVCRAVEEQVQLQAVMGGAGGMRPTMSVS